MLVMPSTEATRLLLFADVPRRAAERPAAKIRRYRLARLQLAAPRGVAGEPRYAYLKRSYD
jgi:hypothetical protein